MHVSIEHRYNADIDQVVAMMRDPDYLRDVVIEAGATPSGVSIDGDRMSIEAAMPAPSKAQKFVGSTMTIRLHVSWALPNGAASTTGRLDVEACSMPASMKGTGVMRCVGPHETQVNYDADFSISVPLIGRSLEQAAAPYIRRVIDTQQIVGSRYLDNRQK